VARRLIVAGGGLAGLVAGVRAAELGAVPAVHEKSSRPGGSMLLSSGVIWRHASWTDFRRECPDGDEPLQRLVWERLDEAIAWLRRLGAPVAAEGTGNPRTTGVRFDPAGLTDTLAARLPPGGLVLEPAPLDTARGGDPVVLATGGFAASPEEVAARIAPAAPLRLRGNPWSTGDGLRHGLAAGGTASAGMAEFFGRNMPAAPWGERDFVPAAQLYAAHARIFDEDGVEFFDARDASWPETNVVQATARRPNARAYYLLDARALTAQAGRRTVAEMVAEAPREARPDPADLPFPAPPRTLAAVHVAAAITHTIGGLRIDDRARVLTAAGEPVDGLYAAGVDAGGVATGGYASGLAQALVLGLVAAESALA
jgi:succinate dehydrogenase/fumarate reductase flavoprotein subunit